MRCRDARHSSSLIGSPPSVNADRIVVLRNGHIEEIGTHVGLMHNGGYYASLVRGQAGGMLISSAA